MPRPRGKASLTSNTHQHIYSKYNLSKQHLEATFNYIRTTEHKKDIICYWVFAKEYGHSETIFRIQNR